MQTYPITKVGLDIKSVKDQIRVVFGGMFIQTKKINF